MKKQIPQKLLKRAFSVQEALSYGLGKATLTRMVKDGRLDRLSRGVYQTSGAFEGTGEELYKIATLRCGLPSAICLLSALEHYHVTDQISKQVWVLVPESKRISSDDLKLIRSRNPQWNIGIKKTKHYWITSLERTLIDCLLYKQMIGISLVMEAIKKAISQKKINLSKLYDMAKKMGVDHLIRSYMEALA